MLPWQRCYYLTLKDSSLYRNSRTIKTGDPNLIGPLLKHKEFT